MRKSIVFFSAIVSVLLLVGCSKSPVTEIQNSDNAMKTAQADNAEQYAPDAYKMAMDTLNAANEARAKQDSKFALFRSYGKSKDLYKSASVLMQKASTEAQAAKENTRTEVMQIMISTQTMLDSATTLLDKAPRTKGSKADIELIKSDLASAKSAFTDASADYNSGNYLEAKTKFLVVSDRAQKIISEVNAALAKKTGK